MTNKRLMALATCIAWVPCIIHAQALLTERNISLNAAYEAASAALAQCRKDGLRVTVTVLERSGMTRVVLRDDGTSPHTIENSLRKGYTALTFRQPSADAGKRFASNPVFLGFLHLDKVTTLAGGLPIRAGNEVVGAIGISGAPMGEQDAACAQVGLDHIAKSLSGG
ncbi:MAG: hypothetical protein V7606_548 [Burkholderiales bacterium]